jgi:hypothetical protein
MKLTKVAIVTNFFTITIYLCGALAPTSYILQWSVQTSELELLSITIIHNFNVFIKSMTVANITNVHFHNLILRHNIALKPALYAITKVLTIKCFQKYFSQSYKLFTLII